MVTNDKEIIIQLFTGGYKNKETTYEQIEAKLLPIVTRIKVKKVIAGWNLDRELYQKLCAFLHQYQVECYLWLPVFSETGELKQVQKTVDYTAKDVQGFHLRDGEDFEFYCPNVSANIQRVIEIYEENFEDLAFDGIFLDKIRYGSFSTGIEGVFSCFCSECEKKYIENGISVEALKKEMKQVEDGEGDYANSPLGLCSYKQGSYSFSNDIWSTFFEIKAKMIYEALVPLCDYFHKRNLKIGMDTFFPFLGYFVGQDYHLLSQLADFIKPMMYRNTNAPAGLEHEVIKFLEATTKEDLPQAKKMYGDILASKIEEKRLLALEFLKKEVEYMTSVSNNVYCGIEVNHIEGITEVGPHNIQENLEELSKTAVKGVVLGWDILCTTQDNIDSIFSCFESKEEDGNYALEMKDIHKNFGNVSVLHGVDFSLKKGEIKALLGANGAGKSTLMKILGGVYPQTKGEIFLGGKAIAFKNPQEAKKHGISTIYQELSLIPTMSVLDNIFLGRESKKGIFLQKKKMKTRYQELCDEFDFYIDPDIVISKLSIANQQMVEIMKAISFDADILVMDEPTTSLTSEEKENLFQMVHKLKLAGKSIIFISHVLEDVFQLCDSVSIMRNGQMVGDYAIRDLTKQKIAELITGKIVQEFRIKKEDFRVKGNVLLELKNVSDGKGVKNVNLKLYQGEVLGVAGLVGSKRTEMVHLLYGLEQFKAGEMKLHGKTVKIRSPREAIAHKIAYIPEDRKNQGLILEQEVYKNTTGVQLNKFRTMGFLDEKKEKAFTAHGVHKLGIKTNGLNQKTKELSGGNQQKVVLSKWLKQDLDLIIYDEPTKGIDIGAKEDIFKTIDEFSEQGVSVIFISSNLEEVLRVSDRVLVVRDGSIIAEMQNENLEVQDIMNKIFNI